MPDAQGAVTVMQFLNNTYGPLNLLLLGCCAYLGWSYSREQKLHENTRSLLATGQEQMVKMQIQYVQVLTELKSLIEVKLTK